MADHDGIWSAALQEAYATAPVDEVILETIELRHPALEAPVRVVRDHGTAHTIDGETRYGWTLTLEDDAPEDAGGAVFFQSLMFSATLPEQGESLPSAKLILDNVSREIMGHMDSIISRRARIEVTYREFLASDVAAPSMVLRGLSLKRIKCGISRVVGTLRYDDLTNLPFPDLVYREADFPGLSS